MQKARVISERMFKSHNERDFDLDWHKEKVEQLGERWRNVHLQIENRSVRRLFKINSRNTHFIFSDTIFNYIRSHPPFLYSVK